ncbi:MAG: hypothetical protein JNK15_11560 [Planctomycetes bacterium]|nr:hypothetical protein [Planctomycetota bacterium]
MRKNVLRLALSLTVTLVLLLCLEGGASLWSKWPATGALPPVLEVTHCEYDPELGWRHCARKHVPNLYGPGIGITTNSQHLRGTRDHALADDAGKYRVLCLGDSFTMGYGVSDGESYPAQLEGLHPGLETINMGLGGYGIDQCWMWYERDGTKFDVDVLLFAFILGDFYRMNPNGNVANIPKPVLQLVNGDPVAMNVPVANILEVPGFGARLGKLVQASALLGLFPKTLAAPAASGEEPFVPISLRIFEILRDRSQQRGQKFVLVYLPVLEEIALPRHPTVDDWLVPELGKRGIPMLDLRPAFRKVPQAELVEHFTLGHYSKRGNRVAAEAMLAGLRELDPECPR